MDKIILVPLDGSPLAEGALPHAREMVRATGGELALLRVVPSTVSLEQMTWPVGTPILHPQEAEPEIGQAEQYLDLVAQRLRAEGVPAEVHVRVGDPATEIVAWAQQASGLRLIVMASHGRGGFGRWVFGSVAEKALRAAPAPLLLVPAREERATDLPVSYRTILVAHDGSALAERALEEAATLGRALHAELLLVTVTPSLEEIGRAGMASLWLVGRYADEDNRILAMLTKKAATLSDSGLPARAELYHGAPADLILEVSRKKPVDLIVMGTHGRSGWQQLWMGSVALKVAQDSTVPLLLMRGPEAPPA